MFPHLILFILTISLKSTSAISNSTGINETTCSDLEFWNESTCQCTFEQCPNLNSTLNSTKSDSKLVSLLSQSVQNLIDLTSFRGDSHSNFRLSLRELNTQILQLYQQFVHSIGRNIYPLIIFSDYNSFTPEVEGIGGVYRIYFANGTMRQYVPVGERFEVEKCLSHIPIGLFAILGPYFRTTKATNWKKDLRDFGQKVKGVFDELDGNNMSRHDRRQTTLVFEIVEEYINQTLVDNSVDYRKFRKFANLLAPWMDSSMKIATRDHVQGVLPSLLRLKEELGPEWSRVHVIIPSPWPTTEENIRLKIVKEVMSPDQVESQIFVLQGVKTDEEARDVMGRVVASRVLGQFVFGGKGERKEHLESLSSRREIVYPAEVQAIKDYYYENPKIDSANIQKKEVRKCKFS